mmetsp:Transcript_17958/g.24872  ORF Transcript_17958/g.24872 Transcript_17958/m.24872 type:complete len:302 (+) Transcript_17958:142-1047(+)
MGRCAIQIVMGPAGSGKSTYCQAMQEHCATIGGARRRRINVANLDPAAENFNYEVAFDIRELISVDDVMEELGLGPNGALVYCMEYLLENPEWLHDNLEAFGDDEYIILDCPGQVELYTHVPVMRRVLDRMRVWGYGSSMVGVFVVDATFLTDTSKFLSGSLLSLSAMISLELPHVNMLSKCDLVSEETVEKMLGTESATQLWDFEEHSQQALAQAKATRENDGSSEAAEVRKKIELQRRKRNRLTEAICTLLDDFSMVSFCPLNIMDEDSLDHALQIVDHAIQYGEDLDVKGAEGDDSLE